MNAEELAADLEAEAKTCRRLQLSWGNDTHNFSRLGGKAVAYEHCAALIRQDLTPSSADMQTVYDASYARGRRDGLEEQP